MMVDHGMTGIVSQLNWDKAISCTIVIAARVP
ncbi:MAG: hypothetical protein RL441_1326, partial [Actinomycetota bacterium]